MTSSEPLPSTPYTKSRVTPQAILNNMHYEVTHGGMEVVVVVVVLLVVVIQVAAGGVVVRVVEAVTITVLVCTGSMKFSQTTAVA